MGLEQEYKAFIAIFSRKLTAEEIALIVHVPYTRKYEKGTPRGRGVRLKHKEHAWILDSSCNSKVSFQRQFEQLLQRFSLNNLIIKKLEKYKCYIQFTGVYCGTVTPVLHFSPNSLEKIGKLRAHLEIDILYCE